VIGIRARGRLALVVAALAVLALAAAACAPSFEPYDSAEDAARDYAIGVLTGDAELASRAAAQRLDAGDLDRERAEIFGISRPVSATDVVIDDAGGEAEGGSFLVQSYTTPEGENIALVPVDEAPVVWTTVEDPWHVTPLSTQSNALWFVAAVLVAGLAVAVAFGVLLVRMANAAEKERAEQGD